MGMTPVPLLVTTAAADDDDLLVGNCNFNFVLGLEGAVSNEDVEVG